MSPSLTRVPFTRRGRARFPRALVFLSLALIIATAPAAVRAASGVPQPTGEVGSDRPQPPGPPVAPTSRPRGERLTDSTVPNGPKLDAALTAWSRARSGPPSAKVIVTAAPGQLAFVKGLVNGGGSRLRGELPGINAVSAEVSLAALAGLTANRNVLSVSLDAPLAAIDGNMIEGGTPTPPTPTGELDGASDTNPSLRDVLGLAPVTPDGAEIGVAIIDSGLAPSADFADRIDAFYDFTADGNPARPVDPYGHGTHVAGIIGSSGATSMNGIYRGLGPRVRLIGLRVLDANGAGETSRVIAAIEFATINRLTLGIHVINLALGHPIYERVATDPLVRAVEQAVDAGIVVVVSAGNYGFNRTAGRSGYAGITSPGNAPSAITVGALASASTVARGDDEVMPYSSRGPSWYDGLAKPDVLAPGHGITSNGEPTSALYQAYPSIRAGGSHMRLNGTSMAAAATAGVVALMIDAHRQTHVRGPALAPNTIKAILQYTATPLGASASNGGAAPDALIQGAGAINVPAALTMARGIDASRPLGADWLSGSHPPASFYDGLAERWSQTITWGATAFSGDLLNVHRASWDQTSRWGTAVEWSADVTAGPNLVWDRAIDWAANIVWGPELVGWASDTGDQTYVWGYVDSSSTTTWGNLETVPGGGQTFVWGYGAGATP